MTIAERLCGFPGTDAAAAAAVKIGVIGCGYWGPQLIRNLEATADADLVAVVDRRPQRLEYVSRQFPAVQAMSDYRRLLDSDVEAVVLATPIHTHFELAREALLAGKHVLVEKPMATSLSEACELSRLADQLHRTLMVGHTFVYNPAVEELRRIVASGRLGRILYADCARLNLGLIQTHVNVIWDLAPHDISILLHVLKRTPKAVAARGQACVHPTHVDVAYLEMAFEGDVSAHIRVSWLDPAKVRRTTIVGERQMVVFNDVPAAEKLRIYDKSVTTTVPDDLGGFQASYRYGDVMIPHIEWTEPLRVECEHFVDCVRSGKRPRSGGYEGMLNVAVLEAAERSLHHGGRFEEISVPEPTASQPREKGLAKVIAI